MATSFTFELSVLSRFFAGFNRITPGDFLVPRRMKCPRPRFANGAANHRLKCAGLSDRAQVNVNEDTAQHNHRGNIVQHIAHGDGPASASVSTHPQTDSCDNEDHTASDDLPELCLLSAVEEAGFGMLLLFFSSHNIAEIPHPPRVRSRPLHGLNPVQHLQSEEDHKSHTEPRMHRAAERPSSKNRSEPAEKPG